MKSFLCGEWAGKSLHNQEALLVNIDQVRSDFPFLKRRINDKPIIYFDNAATTQKPQEVIDKLVEYYSNHCANIHRGIHTLSEEASELYEEARSKVARFINADEGEIVFLRNATEAINLVSHSLNGNGKIVTTVVEHHSNLLPWSTKRDMEYADIHDNGVIDIEDLRRKMDGSVHLVALCHVSNVLGIINPVEEVIEIAKEKGAYTLIDASQSIPHVKIDVQKLGCDFLAFSGHKMLGPSGIGVLYARKELLKEMTPFLLGGSTIKEVHLDDYVPEDPPRSFEAGTPNIEGAIGLGAAIDYIERIGMDQICEHERKLMRFALERMSTIRNIEIYGPMESENKLAVIPFNSKTIGAHALAKILCQRGNVMIRSGFHCAQPLHDRLKIPPCARASFYLYNTEEEVETMVDLLKKVADFL
jgi:cysteine desulfurase/selenocysteine lyase